MLTHLYRLTQTATYKRKTIVIIFSVQMRKLRLSVPTTCPRAHSQRGTAVPEPVFLQHSSVATGTSKGGSRSCLWVLCGNCQAWARSRCSWKPWAMRVTQTDDRVPGINKGEAPDAFQSLALGTGEAAQEWPSPNGCDCHYASRGDRVC